VNYLADTNVLSEPRQKRPRRQVMDWLRVNEANLYTSVLVIGEIRYGIELLPSQSARRIALSNWLEKLVDILAGRVLSVNTRVAEEWARLQAEMHRKRVVLPVVDGLLAATARRYGLTVATDNVTHFEQAGVQVLNPFG
jgi:predicted nucleic acid-binding protein